MATITEDYCSFELSKLLKEKGFDIDCSTAYFNGGLVDYTMFGFCDGELLPAPSLSLAMKWLREVHGIFITIEIKGDPRKEDFIYYKWSVAKFNGNQITRIDNGLHTPEDYWVAECEESEDYNKSCETAIKYCLEHLI